jgi:hypothetical protein
MGRKYVGEKRNAYEVSVGTPAGMKPGIGEKIILKWNRMQGDGLN